jgi:hypothetical protein
MTEEVQSIAKGFDLSPAIEQINTISLAAKIEVDMNFANQNARFDVRNVKKEFTE